MKRQGIGISRCRVERLMRRAGISGVVKGARLPKTTIPGGDDQRADDLIDRNCSATRPNQLWIADFTYVPSWEKATYVAFVIDHRAGTNQRWWIRTQLNAALAILQYLGAADQGTRDTGIGTTTVRLTIQLSTPTNKPNPGQTLRLYSDVYAMSV